MSKPLPNRDVPARGSGHSQLHVEYRSSICVMSQTSHISDLPDLPEGEISGSLSLEKWTSSVSFPAEAEPLHIPNHSKVESAIPSSNPKLSPVMGATQGFLDGSSGADDNASLCGFAPSTVSIIERTPSLASEEDLPSQRDVYIPPGSEPPHLPSPLSGEVSFADSPLHNDQDNSPIQSALPPPSFPETVQDNDDQLLVMDSAIDQLLGCLSSRKPVRNLIWSHPQAPSRTSRRLYSRASGSTIQVVRIPSVVDLVQGLD
jgi:hypothetical protein